MAERRITAKEIYDAYNGAEFLYVTAPADQETVCEYVAREDVLNCGDTLFAFLLFELSDIVDDRESAVGRLDRAIADIQSVKQQLSRTQ